MSKASRNEPCPCGSGLKYKKCCLRSRAEIAPQSFVYDADVPPDSIGWMKQSKSDRWRAIERYHEATGACYEDLSFHSFMHSLVEEMMISDQVPQVSSAMDRLLAGGIRRHHAIHAICYKMAPEMMKAMNGGVIDEADQAEVFLRLDQMTAASWLAEKLANRCSHPEHPVCGHDVFADE